MRNGFVFRVLIRAAEVFKCFTENVWGSASFLLNSLQQLTTSFSAVWTCRRLQILCFYVWFVTVTAAELRVGSIQELNPSVSRRHAHDSITAIRLPHNHQIIFSVTAFIITITGFTGDGTLKQKWGKRNSKKLPVCKPPVYLQYRL